MVSMKIVAVHSRSPIYPIPASCPAGYSPLGYNSNIFSETTFPLPYNANGNSLSLTNEIIVDGGSDLYFKVFNANGVKIG